MDTMRHLRYQFAAAVSILALLMAAALSFPVSAVAKTIFEYQSEYQGHIFFENCKWCGKSHSGNPTYYEIYADIAAIEDAQISHSDNMSVSLIPTPDGMFSGFDYDYAFVVETDFTAVGDGKGWFKVVNSVTGEVVSEDYEIPVVNVSDDNEAMLDSLAYGMHPDALSGSLEGVIIEEYQISFQPDPTEPYPELSFSLNGSNSWEDTYQNYFDSYSGHASSIDGAFPEQGERRVLESGIEATFSHWDGYPLENLPDKADFSVVYERKDEVTGLTSIVHEALFVGVWETEDGSPVYANPKYVGCVKPYRYTDGIITFDDEAVGTWYELTIDSSDDIYNYLYQYGLMGECMSFSSADFSKDDPLYQEDGRFSGPIYVRADGDGAQLISRLNSTPSIFPVFSLEPADAGTVSYDNSQHVLTVTLSKPATLHINVGDKRVLDGSDEARLTYYETVDNADKWAGVTFNAEKLEGDAADEASAGVLELIGGNGEAVVYDLHLEKDGQEVQPEELGSSSVQVTLPIPENIDPSYVSVFHVSDEGSMATVRGDVNEEARTFTFSASHFSTYVVAGYVPTESVTMYRLYNRYTGEHFYTASTRERDSLSAQGWTYEGPGWTAPASGDPVYRLYNPYAPGGDHHYTLSERERDALVAEGWRYEGVGWYSAAEGTDRVPLYRQYNPYARTGTHNYTASLRENDHLVSLGWREEGVAWYGIASTSEGDMPSGEDSPEIPGGENQGSEGRTLSVEFVTQSYDQDNFTVSVKEGARLEKPVDPIREGFSFKYWGYPDTGEPFDFSEPITAGLLLYAFWEPHYADTQYDYEVFYLDGLDDTWYQGGFAGGSQRTIYIKTNNPSSDFVLGTECDKDLVYTGISTSSIKPFYYNGSTILGLTYVWSGYFSDIADQGVANGEVPMLKVPDGYVMQVGIKDELPLGNHDLYVYEKASHPVALNAVRVGSITIADGAAAEERWADELLAECTTPEMTPPQKMAAISNHLLRTYRYWTMTNQSEFDGTYAFFAAVPNAPFYVTHRWNSFISPMALEYLANRIGGFESVHNCYWVYPEGSPEWEVSHALVECVYQGEDYFYMACPPIHPEEPPKIDFSNTSAAPFDRVAR